MVSEIVKKCKIFTDELIERHHDVGRLKQDKSLL